MVQKHHSIYYKLLSYFFHVCKGTIVKVKVNSSLIQWCHRPAQFSSNSICAIKSTISLEIKCPQLSKLRATAARNQNSIGDKNGEKPLGETRLSRGSSSPLTRQNQQFNSRLQQSQIVQRTLLVPVVLSWIRIESKQSLVCWNRVT